MQAKGTSLYASTYALHTLLVKMYYVKLCPFTFFSPRFAQKIKAVLLILFFQKGGQNGA